MNDAPVLIVGAGPTGLVLALSLAARGTAFRLISDAEGPGTHSRAMGVHARTLEFYRQYGFGDTVVAAGIKADRFHLRESRKDGTGHEITSVSLADMGAGISPYPFLLTYAQDEHERFLIDRLEAAGGGVEWQTRLTGFTQDADGVQAAIVRADGTTETIRCAYIAGCDGAHSQVRRSLAIDFPGGTYERLFFVADVKLDGAFSTDASANLGEHLLALILPVRSRGMQRLIGLVPAALSGRDDLGFEDIRRDVERLADIRVTQVNWFSTYRVHHRVAAHFHVGRAFLLGDAGHIHSPAGGQGMNTGIGDAINLGWKLAQVLGGSADAKLLETYEPERIGFARKLVATTDRAFAPMVAGGLSGKFVRRYLVPTVANLMTRFAFTRRALFRTLSQTQIHYRESALSDGKAGRVQGGDRLPWTGAAGEDNFAPLGSRDWQVHVYGAASADLRQAAGGLPVHQFAWGEAARRAGFERDAMYLVRPDGYVALAAADDFGGRLEAYVQRFALRF